MATALVEGLDAWQERNRRLTREGWTLVTEHWVDGWVVHYAIKDGVRIETPMPLVEF